MDKLKQFTCLRDAVRQVIRHSALVILFITLLGGFLRFYNLDWGSGEFFHPDEVNIVFAVMNIHPGIGDFNPDFFAYGSFPIYIFKIFAGGDWSKAFLVGRFLSALLSALSIPLVYLISKKIFVRFTKSKVKNELLSLVTSVVVAFTPGLIQYAHFATFESFLTFFYLLIAYFAIRSINDSSQLFKILLTFVIGAAVATKIISLVFIPILPLLFFLEKPELKNIPAAIIKSLPYVILVALVSLMLSPYNLLDYPAFRESMAYEGGLARGTLEVFYTQQFFDTVPGLYQLIKVFPYILGIPLTITSLFAVVYFGYQICSDFFKKKEINKYYEIIIILLITVSYLVFHLSLFVKWTRYMVPVLPFLIILSFSLFLSLLPQLRGKLRTGLKIIFAVSILWTITSGLNFFSKYTEDDPRTQFENWAKVNIRANSHALAEEWEIGTSAWKKTASLTTLDFYEANSNENIESEIYSEVDKSDYIILFSGRVYTTHLRLSERYPITSEFYTKLFNEELGFRLEKRFVRESVFEKLTGSKHEYQNHSFWLQPDETYSVFDSPEVLVFKKVSSSD